MNTIYQSSLTDLEKSRRIREQLNELKLTIRETLQIMGELHDHKEVYTGDLDRMLSVVENITQYLFDRYGEYKEIHEEVRVMIRTVIDPKVKEEGRQEEKLEIAKKMLELGAKDDYIIQVTGLPKHVIDKLK
jgi:hypothetical protein